MNWGRWVECEECGGHGGGAECAWEGGWSVGSVEDMGEVHSELGKVGGVWGVWRTWGRCRVSWGRWVECGECGGHGGGAE